MNSEKVKEIKKALGNCQKNNCLDCPYFIDEKRCRANDLLLDTITLINELESDNERLNNLREVVAPIYVMPNVETPEMILKLGEKNLVQQFAKWLKDDIEHHHGNYGDLSYSECVHIIDERLKWFIGEKFDNEVEE